VEVPNSKSRGKKQYLPTKAGPKHAAQAHLPAHQTKRKNKHRRVHLRPTPS